MKQLIEELENLIPLGVVGIKQSFEDEGAFPQDVLVMRRITEQVGLDLSVKIGGCEAKTDIKFCEKIGVNKIVAPMIESRFALSKFIESVTDINNIKFYINIESHQAQSNIEEILDSPSSKLISGMYFLSDIKLYLYASRINLKFESFLEFLTSLKSFFKKL